MDHVQLGFFILQRGLSLVSGGSRVGVFFFDIQWENLACQKLVSSMIGQMVLGLGQTKIV